MGARLAAALLVPAALVLAGCEANATVEVGEDATVAMTLDLYDSDGSFAAKGLSCEIAAEGLAAAGLDYDLEDYESGGHGGCRVRVVRPNALDGPVLSEDDTTFTLALSPDMLGDVRAKELALLDTQANFTLDVAMPGDVLKASGEADIQGNHATYRSLAGIADGIAVTGKKSFRGSTALAWELATLAVVGLAGVALLFVVLRRYRHDGDDASQDAGPSAVPGAHPEASGVSWPASGSVASEGPATGPVPVPPLGHPDDAGVPLPRFEGDPTAPVVNTESPTVDVNADVPIAPIQVVDAQPADETEEGIPQ